MEQFDNVVHHMRKVVDFQLRCGPSVYKLQPSTGHPAGQDVVSPKKAVSDLFVRVTWSNRGISFMIWYLLVFYGGL